MELKPWEVEAYDKLIELYENFFLKLADVSKCCYRKEAYCLIADSVKELTAEETRKILDYWSKYTDDFDISYHKYYIDKTGRFDVRFIPDDIFAGYIDCYLNNREIEPGIADKNYFDLYLNGFKLPKTYVHLINGIFEDDKYNILTREAALAILVNKKSFTVKPSMASYGGKNVKFFNNSTFDEINGYLNNLSCQNLVFQETIIQSSITAKLHPESLNTIRVMTLLLDNDIKILPAAFRMGINGSSVDNASYGGIYCKIELDGSLSEYAYNAVGKRYESHPNGGPFNQVKLDFIEKIYDVAKQAAQRFPHFRLIGWDIAVDADDEPVIIEANLTMSGMDVIETICGPLFGEYTDQILKEVFIEKREKNQAIDITQYI